MANGDFRIQQFNDGQVFIHDTENNPLLHAKIKGPHHAEIQVHTEAIIEINKLYGPLIFMPIRVRLDFDACEWIIERGDMDNEWHEVGRFPGQIPGDFVV